MDVKSLFQQQLVNRTLLNDGWKVLRFWGEEIKNNLMSCVKEIERAKKPLE